MGEYWILVNLDKRQKINLYKLGERRYFRIHECLSVREFAVSTAAEYIDQLRRRAEREWKKDMKSAAKARARGSSSSQLVARAKVYRRIEQRQSTFLTKLPVEVLSICVGFADTLRDMACFGLTCQYAWDIAHPRIVKYLRAYETWAGDRILCIGDYTMLDNAPPNVLNDEELAVLRDVKAGKFQPPTDDSSSDTPDKPFYLTEFLDALDLEEFRPLVKDVEDWLAKHVPFKNRSHNYEHPAALWSDMVKETYSHREAAGTVLRNLTTHEIIRGDAYLAAREKNPESTTPIDFWELADILLLRIAWAPDTGDCWTEMMGCADPRGAWAGHRFDFIEEDELPRDKTARRRPVLPPWKDVSNELIKALLRCYGW